MTPRGEIDGNTLRAALARGLAERGDDRVIVQIERKRSDYQMSFSLEELLLRFENGDTLKVLFKDTSTVGLTANARAAKPEFLYHPRREIEVYRSVLAGLELGTAQCLAALIEPSKDHYGLFLEKVVGQELYQIGEIDTWQRVSRWLAEFHARFAADAERIAAQLPLIRYNARFFRIWPERAIQHAPESNRAALSHIAARYGPVVDRLVSLPTTLLHGEFYASNVIVAGDRVCPVDWEMAAIGPGLIDLAALCSGRWTDSQRLAIASAYASGVQESSEFGFDLDCCRLHLALQWLGWSRDWRPPTEHAYDWFAEANKLAQRLGIL
ncbi:MAG: phosphotransferase family protein [Gemmataceae bacterium]